MSVVLCVGKHKFIYLGGMHSFLPLWVNVLSIFPVAMQNAGGGHWGFKGSPGSTEWRVLSYWSQVHPLWCPPCQGLPRQWKS